MTKRILFFSLTLMLVLNACSAAAEPNVVVEDPAKEPADTQPATETPEPLPPTATLEPTATATLAPQPQPITGNNLAALSFEGLVDLPRKANLVWPYIFFAPDSQSIIMQTESGVDVLNPNTLDVTTAYPGITAVGFLADGRLYGQKGGQVILMDVSSGAIETVDLSISFSGLFTISPQGDQLAYIKNDKSIEIVDLSSGEATEVRIKSTTSLSKLFFSGDGGVLIVWWGLEYPRASYIAYDASTGSKLYEQGTHRVGPELLADGEHVSVETKESTVSIRTIVGNKETAATDVYTEIGDAYFYGEGFSIADTGEVMVGRYISESPGVAVIAITIENGQSSAFISYPFGPDPEIITAPDGSAFMVVWPDGRLDLYQLDNGDLLAESDRYTIRGSTAFSPDGTLVAWVTTQELNVYNWQTGEVVLQENYPSTLIGVGRVGFFGEKGLYVEVLRSVVYDTWGSGANLQLDLWNIASGQITTTYDFTNECDVQDDGQYIKCTTYRDDRNFSARRIFSISDPNNILVSDNTDTVFMMSSPTADTVAYCNIGDSSIGIRAGIAPVERFDFTCQPFFYSPGGDALYLQNGTVVEIATGEAIMQLDVDDSGISFEAGFVGPILPFFPNYQLEDHVGKVPKFYFGDSFIVINNRIFDAESGALLAELAEIDSVYGITLTEDGLSLMLLTNRGMERWQILE